MNIQERIGAAISRAAARYQGQFVATTAAGVNVAIVAVKRDAATVEPDPNVSARLFEFVLTPKSGAALLAAVGGSQLDKNLPELRKITIREYQDAQLVAEYRTNAARPIAENTPTGGVLRLYAYQTKG